MRRQFKNRFDAFRVKKPVRACLKCGWFTYKGKILECQECNSTCEHFDSEGEYFEYKRLELLQTCGEISGLERQVRYDFFSFAALTQKPVQIFYYKADFVFKDKQGNVVVRDYKPSKNPAALDPVFLLKRRAMKLVYGIEVQI